MLESRLVVVRGCVRWLLAGAAVTWSALAPALGLGEITLHSALNQPLRADITLVDAAGLEDGELSVSLATAEEFSRAGVERGFFLNDLKFTPVLRGNRSLIQVTSSKPVNEPFLNFLVQLHQPNGRLLREYTVLIDPPGTPGIEPATDESVASLPASAFPSVQPAVAPAPREPLPKPAAAPTPDPLAEQLAASVLQSQQLQSTVDELNAKLQAQDEQIAVEKKQVTELQTRLAEVEQARTAPAAPVAVTPAPVIAEEPGTDWLLIGGLLVLLALLLLAIWVRRQRQQVQATFGSAATQPSPHEPLFSHAEPVQPALELQSMHAQPEETPANDVPQAQTQENSLRNAGFDAQKLQDIRARHSKMGPVAVAASTALPFTPTPKTIPNDEFQLNLDDLSMDANWDLVDPFETSPSSEPALPQPEIEWEIEPASRPLDDSFLDETVSQDRPAEPSNAGKLEQARTCIDDGDRDSAIELLDELLKEANEPLKQTARSLLAGIR
ncbi:FimV/HubP family polar landmark protein [Pseudomonas sp. Irchel 3A7]|uniref:FimV/HubP family polar landmark protein n=1 Tax=Pseudomonas sp. Irchel 3A7 TaxID=2008913 RepID=UPI000BA45C41|nr:FimV/HubP family polar landmark protein [Pseudomonas sp. Irchel 3A7]